MGHSLYEQIIAFEQSLEALEQAVSEQSKPEFGPEFRPESKPKKSPETAKTSTDVETSQPHALQKGFQTDSVSEQANQLQAQFHDIVTVATTADMSPQIEQRIRPLKTEAHRRLRLLGVEAMRFQSAKQPANIEKCRTQMQAHLFQIRQFMQAIADVIEPEE